MVYNTQNHWVYELFVIRNSKQIENITFWK
jgi:hypothetical protein